MTLPLPQMTSHHKHLRKNMKPLVPVLLFLSINKKVFILRISLVSLCVFKMDLKTVVFRCGKRVKNIISKPVFSWRISESLHDMWRKGEKVGSRPAFIRWCFIVWLKTFSVRSGPENLKHYEMWWCGTECFTAHVTVSTIYRGSRLPRFIWDQIFIMRL